MFVGVSRQFSFDAAHHLPNYSGKCRNLHGHTWTFEVTFFGSVDPVTGMLIDFIKMKDMVAPLLDNLDHGYLNNITGLENPTAENLAGYIFRWLTKFSEIPEGVVLFRVKVWESPDSYAEVTSL